jgi:hypothetical protein
MRMCSVSSKGAWRTALCHHAGDRRPVAHRATRTALDLVTRRRAATQPAIETKTKVASSWRPSPQSTTKVHTRTPRDGTWHGVPQRNRRRALAGTSLLEGQTAPTPPTESECHEDNPNPWSAPPVLTLGPTRDGNLPLMWPTHYSPARFSNDSPDPTLLRKWTRGRARNHYSIQGA